ncbi:MAG: anthranilate phosphoribosyltransferase [Alphaproteobacteria bacterium]|nr:anthranilate phosphoribosyltransferase [Alphaproteobacteria bacterium]
MAADMQDMKQLIAKVVGGGVLSTQEAETAFDIIMSGDATPSQMGGFLTALRMRGEAVSEITGAARTMRAKAKRISAPADAMDIVGTGGDKLGTYNVSTATALVVAASGVPVAKHGNRAASSKSGTADALSQLGVDLDCPFANIEKSIIEAGLGFMIAPRHHGAMRNVMPTRMELSIPTIFNILGPLSNPAMVKRYLIGCFRSEFIEKMAETLGDLGAERAWVVHGHSGMDEISTTGPTQVASLEDGKVTTFEISPADAGLPEAALEDLLGGTPEQNAAAITELLNGAQSPYRDIVLFNAAAALLIAGKAETLAMGVSLAADSIDSGRAKKVLADLVRVTNDYPKEAEA